MSTLWNWFKGLGVAIASAITFECNCAIAQGAAAKLIAQITPDATLPNNSLVTTQDNITIIEGGTQVGNNLFHSFEKFSVPNGATAYFNNATDIHNIISRVTGQSISTIYGTISAKYDANLFLINPNGIIFGPNASLNIGGSFLASTASSINFADGTKFSATDPQTASLLTVSVPIGLQFGATAAPIRNQSQASPDGAINVDNKPVGLQVQSGKTLALVGGDVTLEGGNLTAPEGRIELGSVANNSLVSLNPTNQGWILGYESVQNFQNIQLKERIVDDSKIYSIVDVSGEGGGNIQIRGSHIMLAEKSNILAITLGAKPGGDLTVNASEFVELIGPGTFLLTATRNAGNSGNLTIATQKLIIRNGAQILTVTTKGEGAGGQLIVKASESVDLIGSYAIPDTNNSEPSTLGSETGAAGKAGDITINTLKLRVQDGAIVTAVSSGGVDPQPQPTPALFTPATGKGGNLTVNAGSVELIGTTATGSPSSLSVSTQGSGDAGNLTIATEQLIVRDGAAVTVSSEVPKKYVYLGDAGNLGKAGELNITARSIRLENQGKLSAETDLGQGGNITLQVQNLLLMRRNSQISTNAGNAQAGGDGGNITINAPSGFIVAVPGENSDITANAFTGSGGKVQINANGVFGIVPRSREDLARLLRINDSTTLDPQLLPTSDITAISQTDPTLNGVVNINTPDVDPSQGLINLPVELTEPKLASGCKASVAQNQSSFIITGRGGLPSNPREVLRSNDVQVDWVTLAEESGGALEQGSRGVGGQGRKIHHSSHHKSPSPAIVEAQGWIVDANNDIILVANVPNATPDSPLFNPDRLRCMPEN